MLIRTRQEDEQKAREYLEFLFGQKFRKKRLAIAYPGMKLKLKEFDAVSEDNSVISQVKAYKTGQPEEFKNALSDALSLYLCRAQRKLLFLTDPLFYQLMWRFRGQALMDIRKQGVEIVSPWEFETFCQTNG